MDPDAFKQTFSGLALGNAMAAAARDYQKVPFFCSIKIVFFLIKSVLISDTILREFVSP